MDYLDTILARGAPQTAISGLDGDFATRLQNFVRAAPAPLTIQSGFRSVERQSQLFDDAVRKYGSVEAARKWVAPPGHSMHNEGEAVDLGFGGNGLGKGDPALIDWAHKNAAAYGLTFPLSNENWHIEPIGARSSSRAPDPASVAAASAGAGPSAGPATGPAGPADLHSLVDVMASNNPIERQGMLSGLQDYSFNRYLADAFSGQNPLRRAFYGEISRILS